MEILQRIFREAIALVKQNHNFGDKFSGEFLAKPIIGHSKPVLYDNQGNG
jgi:hypothetical protein